MHLSKTLLFLLTFYVWPKMSISEELIINPTCYELNHPSNSTAAPKSNNNTEHLLRIYEGYLWESGINHTAIQSILLCLEGNTENKNTLREIQIYMNKGICAPLTYLGIREFFHSLYDFIRIFADSHCFDTPNIQSQLDILEVEDNLRVIGVGALSHYNLLLDIEESKVLYGDYIRSYYNCGRLLYRVIKGALTLIPTKEFLS